MRTGFGSGHFWGAALALCALLEVGAAIRCYECNSANNSQCFMDKPPDALKKNCSDHQRGVTYTMCRKIVQVVEFAVNGQPPDTRVIRGCGWDESKYKNMCYQRSGYGGRQEVCSCLTDDCNSASGLAALLPLLLSSLIALKLS